MPAWSREILCAACRHRRIRLTSRSHRVACTPLVHAVFNRRALYLVRGWNAQWEVWRLIGSERLSGFAPVNVSDHAISAPMAL